MSEKEVSWGKASATPKSSKKSMSVKNICGGWTKERLTPKETKRTQTNSVSYTSMTVIYRHGKK